MSWNRTEFTYFSAFWLSSLFYKSVITAQGLNLKQVQADFCESFVSWGHRVSSGRRRAGDSGGRLRSLNAA